METLVKQRVRQLFSEEKKLSERAFSEILGIGQKTFNKQMKADTSMPLSTILLILEHNPNISTEWLLRGTGSMYLNKNESTLLVEKGRDEQDYELFKIALAAKDETIASKNETIVALQNEILNLKKILSSATTDDIVLTA